MRRFDVALVLFPIRFHAGPFTLVAPFEESLQILRRLEPFRALTRLEPLTAGGSQPRAQGHALPTRLADEPVPVLVRDYQLNPGHYNVPF